MSVLHEMIHAPLHLRMKYYNSNSVLLRQLLIRYKSSDSHLFSLIPWNDKIYLMMFNQLKYLPDQDI